MEKLLKLIEVIKNIVPNVMIQVGNKLTIKHEFTADELLDICEQYNKDNQIVIYPSKINPFPNPYNPGTMPVMMYGCYPVDYQPTYNTSAIITQATTKTEQNGLQDKEEK